MLSWDLRTSRDCLKGKCLVLSCHYRGLCAWGGYQICCIGKFQKKTPPNNSWDGNFSYVFHPWCLATSLHLFWFVILSHPGQALLVPSLKHQWMVPSRWSILSKIPMYGYDWKRRREGEVLCYTLDLWRQLEDILQQEANSQGQAGTKGTGLACDSGPLNEGGQFYSHRFLFSKKSQIIPL